MDRISLSISYLSFLFLTEISIHSYTDFGIDFASVKVNKIETKTNHAAKCYSWLSYHLFGFVSIKNSRKKNFSFCVFSFVFNINSEKKNHRLCIIYSELYNLWFCIFIIASYQSSFISNKSVLYLTSITSVIVKA